MFWGREDWAPGACQRYDVINSYLKSIPAHRSSEFGLNRTMLVSYPAENAMIDWTTCLKQGPWHMNSDTVQVAA